MGKNLFPLGAQQTKGAENPVFIVNCDILFSTAMTTSFGLKV